ncbi:recombinase family protein [Nitrobacter sp.]|uniref:recombinase family protein n=1 Tax=Nitrobacter sp. TaxID=29420 RepID=UPI0029CAC0C1|nr:recombinase family protein [Nitrobacter sp.]
MRPAGKSIRCAIYTRVSTDAGLDQEFNSLDAQYDASEAYIRSQAHAGWTLIKMRYDDGGFSGGSTDRPALQKLLDDVRARKINVIVVYKVDRLTRSLADFAKLVEQFDAHGVSFVSVTQQFNTTTSMGRLTLNVLLSFAQFEREVTAERIRDKIAASKRKGLWVGGMIPLGYALSDGKLSIHPDEARTVRLIFERYLELGSVNRLVADLRAKELTSKVRNLSIGAVRGGVPFTQGPLFYMLRNRFYIGEVTFKGEILSGPQPPLLERSLFEAVQAKLTEQWSHRTRARQKSKALLTGLLVDDAGNRMIPTHATRNRVRYRYYISQPLQRGRSDDPVGSISRVPADQIEALIINAVGDRLTKSGEQWSGSLGEQNAVAARIAKVEVRTKHLAVTLKTIEPMLTHDHELARHDDAGITQGEVVLIPWTKPPMRRFRDVIQPASASPRRTRPIRAERRAGLIRAITRGRQWLDEIVFGRATIQEIAVRQKCSVRQINLTLSMAFLAPSLVKAAVEGRLPRGIGIVELRDAPPEWSKQYVKLGLPTF